jgi:3-methylcrotonyl-CoA carboxylase alpha subunit
MKIAIANRGEVAVRIARACYELGHESVLLHSEPDVQTIAYRTCDFTALIGPGPSSESYLNIERVVNAALDSGAEALHPGFGFLSENSDFARACKKAGIIFIGPEPESMDLFGDKISAKDFCEKLEVPTLKSYRKKDQSLKTLLSEAKKIGYPVLIKAAAGGGGRGMRAVDSEKDFEAALESAKNEALKAFGSDQMFLERYLPASKHIEVQIFGTKDEVFVLGERECSVQRRHQKIIEEALSPSLSDEQREQVYSYARKLADSSNYLGAGTVEFLFADGEFYFLEVNTRLQVEHPVTEEVFDVDLVQAQIKTALGEQIDWVQEELTPLDHSIECRIYAESPKGFPYIGTIGTLVFGFENENENIRIESGFESGDTISPFYDSMIAKVICTASTRNEAIDDLTELFETSFVTGIQTNIPLLIEILNHPEFIDASMQTDFFAKNFKDGLEEPLSDEILTQAAKMSLHQSDEDILFSRGWRS